MVPDPGSEAKLHTVYPRLVMKWLLVRHEMLAMNKVQMRVTEGLRTFEEQSRLYSLGRERSLKGVWTVVNPKKVVTHARAGESLHQYGLAIDSCFMGDDPFLEKLHLALRVHYWNDFGTLCNKYGLTWGGDWTGKTNDRPHCEISYGLSIHDLQMLHDAGGIDSIWNKCNQLSLCGSEIA